MNKYIGIAAIVAMVIATGYIVYSTQNKNTLNTAPQVVVTNETNVGVPTEEVKPVVANKPVVEKALQETAYEIETDIETRKAESIKVENTPRTLILQEVTLYVPLGWNAKDRNTAEGIKNGLLQNIVLTSPDFVGNLSPDPLNETTPAIQGSQIIVTINEANVNKSISSPEAYSEFRLKHQALANPKIVLVSGSPFVMTIGDVSNKKVRAIAYEGYYQNKIYLFSFHYTDAFASDKEIFSEFMSSLLMK